MSSDTDIQEALQTIEAGMTHFVTGDSGPFKERWSHQPDVSIMGAWGTAEVGWPDSEPRLDWAAARFKGGNWTQELLTAGTSGDLLYTVTIERMEPVLEGQDAARRSELRVTHVFRREDGVWKVVHRHADPIISKTAAATILQQ
jgi:hypothetical protein